GPVVRVPMLDRRGMVYDSGRDLLYFATDHGTVERYSPTTGVLLAPWKVGNNLRGIDLTPDGSALLVADGLRGATAGFIRRVDTTTGAVTTLNYGRNGLEGGAWDVAAINNGTALFATVWEGSGWTPLHAVQLANNSVTNSSVSLASSTNSASLVSRG